VPASDGFEVIDPRNTDTYDVRWGLQLKPGQARLRCLKLRLDPRQVLPNYVSAEDLDKQLAQCGKTTEEAIADYLSAVHAHAQDALIKRFGEHMMSSTPIEVVLTVPAIWSDAAKDATFRVAQRAGMGTNLRMISEPEAAAIYALESMKKESKLLRVGSNFIVCDCGGGTIDLISMEIRSLAPLSLVESAPGTGALCGGVFLNHRFEALVKSRMGPAAFQKLKPKSWAIALKYFEDYVKKNFDPTESSSEDGDSIFNVPLPGTADDALAGIEFGFITLSTTEVAELFYPLIESIIELIEGQREALSKQGKTAKGVVLVGGFGQSSYLFKCLKTRFQEAVLPPKYTPVAKKPAPRATSKFVVLQPANAWTAVVRGAVLSSLQEKVLSRKARHHYGITVALPFDANKHSLKNKYWYVYTQTFLANNQMFWHAKKGDDLPSEKPILFALSADWDHNDPIPEYFTNSIIISDEREAPAEFELSKQTRTLCSLSVDLKMVPRRHFRNQVNALGMHYRSLNYQIGMTVQSGK